MKKKYLLLISLPLMIGSLSSCGGNVNVEKALSYIEESFAIKGSFEKTSIHDGINPETGKRDYEKKIEFDSAFESLWCSDYTYLEQYDEQGNYLDGIKISIDKDGYIGTQYVDITTNEVDCLRLSTNVYGEVKYNYFFKNPFLDANYIVKGNSLKIDAANISNFDFISLTMIASLYNVDISDISSLEIKCKNGKPSELLFEGYNDLEAGRGYYYSYKYVGKFIDPTSVKVPEDPKPNAAQSGQEVLQAKFDQLKQLNFSSDAVVMSDGVKIAEVTSHVTPKAFYSDLKYVDEEYKDYFRSSGFVQDEVNGALRTFDYNDGTLYERAKPVYFLDYNQILKRYWTASAQCFNVNNDGTYSLANLNYFFDPGSYVTMDEMFIGVSKIDPDTFVCKIENDGSLVYSYTMGNQFTVSNRIYDIGVTSYSVDLSKMTPYQFKTNIKEFLLADNNPNLVDIIDDIVNGHFELIPFYEGDLGNSTSGSTISACLNRDEVIASDGEVAPVMWIGSAFALISQNNRTEESMNNVYDQIMAQMEAIGGFTYNPDMKGYEYKNEEYDIHYAYQIKKGTRYNAFGQLEENAVAIQIVNHNMPEGVHSTFLVDL